MKIKIPLLVFFAVIFSISHAQANNNIKAKDGVFDLGNLQVENIDVIKLEGEWEFYWRSLLRPEDFSDSTAKPKPLKGSLPKSWTTYKIDGEKLPCEGYGTYRLIITKPINNERTVYGLKLFSVFSNYKLWINGKYQGEVGKVGQTKEMSKPEFKFQTVPFVLDPAVDNTGKIEIVIQASNYFHQRAGLKYAIHFSTIEKLRDETRWMDILNLVIIGIILVIGLNHLNMYLFRRKDVSNLYFSIVSLVMILRNVTVNDRILNYIFPNIGWELLVKLDNFSGFGTIPLFTLFVYSLFKDDFPKIIKNILIIFGAVITVFVFSTPAIVYGKFRMLFEIYILLGGLYLTFGVLLVAAIRKRPSGFWSFLGLFILYSTAINDVLSSMNLIDSAYVAPYGLVAFMLIQSFTITSKSARAINQNETLTTELKREKENLEHNIEERTKELKQQQDKLIEHQKNEQQEGWITSGLAKINDVISDNKNDFSQLSSRVLSSLVKYIDASFGALYVLNEEENKENGGILELVADYGMTQETRERKSRIEINIGLVGASFSENRITHIDDVPENYIKVGSGLGESKPSSLIIIPLSIDNNVFGIIELASLKLFTKQQLDFIKRIAFSIANNLNIVRMNEQNQELIEKFKQQAHEMNEKEEEMRQNLEELEKIREEYEKMKGKKK